MPAKLSKKERKALKMFKVALVESLGSRFVEARLFGSKARGDCRRDSDIDVAIIIRAGNWHISDVVYAIATDIFLESGIALSPKVMNERQYRFLKRAKSTFAENIAREGIVL